MRAVRGALAKPGGYLETRELTALGFFAIAISDRLILRFKYVITGMPRNVPTGKQQLLARQQYDDDMMLALTFEGIDEPPTFVTCGYTLGDDGNLGVVSVQCDYGKYPHWWYPIWGNAGQRSGAFEALPLSPDLAPSAVVVRSLSKRNVDHHREVN